jgi:hypothetical protein
MKFALMALMIFMTQLAISQQIPCAKYDEQTPPIVPENTMKGCRSYNELQAAGGIQIEKTKGFKSYACFPTTLPEEASDLFIFVGISGVISIGDKKEHNEHNGFASMKTFIGGVQVNDGFAEMTWIQYPKENPFLWSSGDWVGHGDSQMMTVGASGKLESSSGTDSDWKSIGVPRLHVSVESDTARFRLELNNESGAVETFRFNRWTGRGILDLSGSQKALRCVSAWEPE